MKTYTLVFILITLVASIFMSSCKKENKLSVARYDFRDSLVGEYSCSTRYYTSGSYPSYDSSGYIGFVPYLSDSIDSVNLDVLIVSRGLDTNDLVIKGVFLSATDSSHLNFKYTHPGSVFFDEYLNFTPQDKLLSYSYNPYPSSKFVTTNITKFGYKKM